MIQSKNTMRIEEASDNIVNSILSAYPQIDEDMQTRGIYIPVWGGLELEIQRFVIYYMMYGVPEEHNGNIIEWYKAELFPIIEEYFIKSKEKIKRIGKGLVFLERFPIELFDEDWVKGYLIYEYAKWIKYINSDVLFWLEKECEYRNRNRYANRRSNQSLA